MISELLAAQARDKSPKTLGESLLLGGQKGFGLLLFMLALPSALPIPAPGYGTFFGVLILFVALQMLWGRREPWLPQKCKNYKWSFRLDRSHRWVRFLLWAERLVQPRWEWVLSFRGRLAAVSIVLSALVMCVPLPGTNTLPALSVLIVSMGLIQRDGLVVLLGVVLNLLVLFGLMTLFQAGFEWFWGSVMT